MKKILLSTLIVTAHLAASAQDFQGFRAGNYTGVNGVFFNPANIADSRFRFDFNLVSVSASVGNNQASFNLKNVFQSFNTDSLESQLFGGQAGATSALVNVDVHGPSLMFNAGKKTAIALTTRSRTMANVIDIDGKLLKQLSDDAGGDASLPYTISSNENMRLTVNSWTEFGFSFARVLADRGAHFFKGGFTAKYIAGIGNGFVGVDKLNAVINENSIDGTYMTNARGRISTGFGGISISDLEPENLTKMESTGFGGDLGFVYEFRPDHEDYKVSGSNWMDDRNKYKFKIGVALLDIGSVKYKKDMERSGAYDINIDDPERLRFNELSEEDFDSYNAFFRSKPQFFTPAASNNETEYKVALPSTLQLDLDYHVHRGFYTSVAAQIPLSNNQMYNSRYYSSFTFTPRYEGKAIGLYVPFNYNSLTNFNAGVSLRLGPVFIGSGSILSSVFGDSKQADVHVGLHLAGLKKKETKKKAK